MFLTQTNQNFPQRVQACLNSRPLCSLSNDPHNSFLSPGHFLIGQPLTQLPSTDYTSTKPNRLHRWQSLQQQLQNFWKRWSADYLHELQTRQRWHQSSPNVQVGDAVILRELNTAPLHWPTAIITEVHPGPDGKVCVVTVKIAKGKSKRPIFKISPLPHMKNKFQLNIFFCGGQYIRARENFGLFGSETHI